MPAVSFGETSLYKTDRLEVTLTKHALAFIYLHICYCSLFKCQELILTWQQIFFCGILMCTITIIISRFLCNLMTQMVFSVPYWNLSENAS